MTTISVKLDENLSQTHEALVRAAGCEAHRVTEQKLSGAADDTVWQRVQSEGRFFITLDLDFSGVRKYSPGTHSGLLLLRPRSNSKVAVTEILERVLHDHPLSTLAGCLVVADPSHTRIRRPSAPDASSSE